MKKLPWNTTEEFENICMDVIECVATKIKTRSEAIEFMKTVVNKPDIHEIKLLVYKRVLEEFKIATNTEYAMLRKVILNN